VIGFCYSTSGLIFPLACLVEYYMYIPGKLNIALNKECQQSSTFGNSVSNFGPQLAVDGDTHMKYNEGAKCTHTDKNQPSYWWTVNLGSLYTIDYITIYNREDCCCEYIYVFTYYGTCLNRLFLGPGFVFRVDRSLVYTSEINMVFLHCNFM